MDSRRVPNWPLRLDEVVMAARDKSFAYGAFDCALFAADCVHAIVAIDYAAELRGYDSPRAAFQIVKRYGSIEAMVTALLDQEPVHISQARRGDVVLANFPRAPVEDEESVDTIGMCLGFNCVFPGANGIVVTPRSLALKAWRID